MPDPPGGRFERDASGELNGRVADRALDAALEKIPDTLTRDDHRRAVALVSKLYASYGMTSACDADTTHVGMQAYQDARDSGELLFRAYCHVDCRFWIAISPPGCILDSAIRWCASAASSSMRMGRFPNAPRGWPSPMSAFPVTRAGVGTRESLYANSRKAWLGGLSACTHANGERAIDRMLGIYEQLQRETPRRIRASGSNTARW